jgi:ketosteroid isomerase-like protein
MSMSSKRGVTYVPPTPDQMAQAEAWVALFADHWDRPDADRLHDMMHPDTRNLIPPMTEPGNAQAVIEHFRGVIARVPGFRLDVLQWAPIGDTVMIEWQAHADIAGKPLTWRGIDRISLRDGKTYEGQVFYDTRAVAEMLAAAVAEARSKPSAQIAATS